MGKDLYGILGILPNASDDIVKAVYRALAKKHHPDMGGNPDRFREITAAYAILSDPLKRRDYDRSHDLHYSPETDIGETDEELEREWDGAIQQSPEIDLLYWELKRYSNSLALNFRLTLLKTRTYGQATALFTELEKAFFETYFGTSPKIHTFVKFLLIEGHRLVAKELNRTLKTMGGRVEADAIIARLCRKHGLIYYRFNGITNMEEKY